ncbi:MAG: hypothetical protein QOG55_1857, partial [Acidobacteriaceae bacterium]|nr:hypothetical protein [Acidobacteriaceae bacterium]
MNGRISAALLVMVGMILFAGSAASRQDNDRQNDGRQDNGQQASPPPQNSDDTRRDDTRKPDDDRARTDDRRADAPEEGERVTLPPDSIISVRIADEINSSKNHTGDILTGIVDPSVLIHDQVMIPRGTEAHVR